MMATKSKKVKATLLLLALAGCDSPESRTATDQYGCKWTISVKHAESGAVRGYITHSAFYKGGDGRECRSTLRDRYTDAD